MAGNVRGGRGRGVAATINSCSVVELGHQLNPEPLFVFNIAADRTDGAQLEAAARRREAERRLVLT